VAGQGPIPNSEILDLDFISMENDFFVSLQQLPADELWRFFPIGYLLTIAVETPILLLALSRHHPWKRKLLAGVWLTACTYPIVTLVLPLLMQDRSRATYLLVAEVFAPVAECILFWLAFGSKEQLGRASMWRDFAAIVAANLASFAVGEVLNAWQWFGLFHLAAALRG
jgi:hypothetical protein